jgi:(E)-4-hydroxy-3-methylbut-2-enyl-diphosphate synthase
MSALYEDGERVGRLDNSNILDQLEARIRAKASQLDPEKRIQIQEHHE